MAYANPNFKSKKALKEAVAANRAEAEAGGHVLDSPRLVNPPVRIFSPGPFPLDHGGEGEQFLEGPHYPKPHTWYAKVRVERGVVVKVLS